MKADWWPFSRTTTIARSATSVLPEPTSPWTSRFMGWGERRSSAISRSTRLCAPVSGKGRIRFTASRAASRTSKAARFLSARSAAAAPGEAELEEEQLLEDEAHVARRAEAVEEVEIVRLAGQVHAPQGLAAADEREPLAEVPGQGVLEAHGHLLREVREDAPQGLDRERAELLVDRDEAAGVDPAVLVPLDDLVLRRAHHEEARAHGVGLDEAEEDDPLPAGERLLQVRLVEEHRLEPPAAVVEAHLVDRQAPRAPQPGHRDLAGDGDAHAGAQVGHAREAPPVLVAHGQVEQEVLGGAHADLRERLGLLRADALDELDRRVEVHVPRVIFPRPAAGRGPTGRNRRAPAPASRRTRRAVKGSGNGDRMSKPCGRFSLRVDWLTIWATSAGGRLIPATSASSTSTLPVPSALAKRPRSSTGTAPLRNASRPAPAPGGIFDFTRSRSSIPRATTRSFWRPSSRAREARRDLRGQGEVHPGVELSLRDHDRLARGGLARAQPALDAGHRLRHPVGVLPAQARGSGRPDGSRPSRGGAAWASRSATRPSGRIVTRSS